MSEEKCFCHLNGYKVKDADARNELEKIANAIQTFLYEWFDDDGEGEESYFFECIKDNYIDTLKEMLGFIVEYCIGTDQHVDAANKLSSELLGRVGPLERKVTALEEAGTGGGTQLYLHEYVKDSYILRIITNVSTSLPLENVNYQTLFLDAIIYDKNSSGVFFWRKPIDMIWDKGTVMYTYFNGSNFTWGYPIFSGYTETITKW